MSWRPLVFVCSRGTAPKIGTAFVTETCNVPSSNVVVNGIDRLYVTMVLGLVVECGEIGVLRLRTSGIRTQPGFASGSCRAVCRRGRRELRRWCIRIGRRDSSTCPLDVCAHSFRRTHGSGDCPIADRRSFTCWSRVGRDTGPHRTIFPHTELCS